MIGICCQVRGGREGGRQFEFLHPELPWYNNEISSLKTRKKKNNPVSPDTCYRWYAGDSGKGEDSLTWPQQHELAHWSGSQLILRIWSNSTSRIYQFVLYFSMRGVPWKLWPELIPSTCVPIRTRHSLPRDWSRGANDGLWLATTSSRLLIVTFCDTLLKFLSGFRNLVGRQLFTSIIWDFALIQLGYKRQFR